MSILSQIQNDQMVTSEVPFEKKFCSGGINQIADAHYHGWVVGVARPRQENCICAPLL